MIDRTSANSTCLSSISDVFTLKNKLEARFYPQEKLSKALIHFTEIGNLEAVSLLVEKGADIHVPDSDSYDAPLRIACSAGNLEMAKLLISLGADLEASAIPYPDHFKNIELPVTIEGELGGDMVDVWPDSGDGVPIRVAAANGHTEVVKLLLDCGADINPKRPDRYLKSIDGKMSNLFPELSDVNIPLQNALNNGHFEAATELITRGASCRRLDIDSVSKVFSSERYDILNLLRENGLVPDDCLRCAAKGGMLDLVKELVAEGADLHKYAYILPEVAFVGDINMVRYLTHSGVDIDSPTLDRNLTAIAAASVNGDFEIVKYLCNHGASLNSSICDSLAPLRLACGKREYDIARLLVINGAGFETTIAEGTQADTDFEREQKIFDLDKTKANRRYLRELCGIDFKLSDKGPFNRDKRGLSNLARIALHSSSVVSPVIPGDKSSDVFQRLMKNNVNFISSNKDVTFNKYALSLDSNAFRYESLNDVVSEIARAIVLPLVVKRKLLTEDVNPHELKVNQLDLKKINLLAARVMFHHKTTLDICSINELWHKPGNGIPDEYQRFQALAEWIPWFNGKLALSDNYTLEALSTWNALRQDGDILGHCVGRGSYSLSCQTGLMQVLSLNKGETKVATAIYMKENETSLWQRKYFVGPSNRSPTKAEINALDLFDDMYDAGQFKQNEYFGLTADSANSLRGLSYVDRLVGFPVDEMDHYIPLIYQHYQERITWKRPFTREKASMFSIGLNRLIDRFQ